MLRNKLFLIIVSILSVTLIISGLIYFKNLTDIFNMQIHKDLTKDQKYLQNYISQTQNNLISLTYEIVQNEDLKSSLNLISLYEDPNDYVKETFDFEKNNLISLSNKWIKQSAHYSISLFNKDLNLIAVNRKLDEDILLGYVTYDENGKKLFLDFESKTVIPFPKIESPILKDLNKNKTEFFIERFLISYLKEVELDGQIIGYVKITTCIDGDVLDELNKSLNLATILSDQEGNLLFPSKIQKNDYEKIESLSDFHTIKSNLLNLENKLYAISIVDKTLINKKTKQVVYSIIEVWIILLIIIFLISAYFINKSILKPIDILKETIKNIKEGKRLENNDIRSKNELSQIVNDFNKLSMELSKNIAFFKSHQLAMDKSSIVTKSDLRGNITYANDNFTKLTGYTKEEAIGKPHNIVRHPDNPKELFEDLWNTVKSKNVWKKILKNKNKFGEDYWVDTTILPILDENDNIVEYMAVRYDITKTIEQQQKLDKIANTDTLTGLGNRYKLLNDIKTSTKAALAIINIDNFSQINDFYGHMTGDYVIKEFGLKLEKNKHDDDCMIYHLQGDEYVLFHKNIDKESFLENLRKILNVVSKVTVNVNGERLSFNFSTAVSFEDKENILTTADMALKVAKRDNKDLVVYKDEISLNKEYENNLKWSKKIKEAISKDLFIPVFQPIVNNSDLKKEKYECLVRMEDEDQLISPYFFLDISKKTKHYTDITKIMIEKSFNNFKDKNLEFSINLTIEDILNGDIQTFIFLMLEQYGIGEKVVFEIVESESIKNFKEVIDFIENVKSYNCKIAIDDFGTGYSNFEYLIQLKADFIKIDGSLIRDIDKNEASQIVVKNIVNFAKDLNMKTIAEFVENEAIFNKLKQLNVDYSQGYHFGAPQKNIKD